MNRNKEINAILRRLKAKIGVKGNIKVRLKPFKRKVASVSLNRKVIYLNSKIIDKLTNEELEYLIAHELLHLKHGVFHTKEFEKELKNLFKEDLQLEILRKFFNIVTLE